ncbi:MAG TPA: hypothetical protein VM911_21405 [Pyrinomonadaceae bacterium]|jgi:hypothetical protein|nr:hypothetical protein [Pyrinomonadaceae bacterium]
MPGKTFFIIENIPSGPVAAAVTSTAIGAVEGCDFQIKLMQLLDIASKNDTEDALKNLSANSEGQMARKAVSDDLSAIIMLKESYVSRFIIATGASEAVLGYGS